METLEHAPETRPLPQQQNRNRGLALGLIAIGALLVLGNMFDLGILIVLLLGLIFIVWGLLTRTAGLLIPGGILSGIGTGIALEDLLHITNDELGGGVFLLAFGAGWFSIVLLSWLWTREPQWWAAIPGSILGGIGSFVLLTEGPLRTLNDDAKGALFMLMFAAGWVVVAFVASVWSRKPVWWPLIPGTIMGFIGAAVLFGGAWVQTLEFVSDWWPLGLIAVGVWLLVQRVTSDK